MPVCAESAFAQWEVDGEKHVPKINRTRIHLQSLVMKHVGANWCNTIYIAAICIFMYIIYNIL